MESTSSDYSKTALLCLDFQNGIVKGIIGENPEKLAPVHKAIEFARKNNIQIIHSVVKFRPGFPEVTLNNKMFSFIKEKGAFGLDTEEGTAVHESVALQGSDLLVTKRRVSAFKGSDLEVILSAKGITHLVFSGISTSGVILSTVREAADKDFKLTVLSDAVYDGDSETHNLLLTKVFPRQADIVTVEDWTK